PIAASMLTSRTTPDLYSFPTRRSSDLVFDEPECDRGLLDRHLVGHGVLGDLRRSLVADDLVQRGDDGRARLGQEAGALLIGSETDRKSTRLNSSHVSISYAVFCLKKKT